MNRRQFCQTAAPALTAGSWARVLGANERIRIASIGCGVQGTEHTRAMMSLRETDRVEIAAVCDVFDRRSERAASLTGGKPCRDYRRVLENKDIDAVVIAVPDHWHAALTLQAVSAGKHVYCEKPMTHTIEEAQQVVAKVGESRAKVQVGVQAMSDDSYETAYRYVRDGAIGKVVVAQIDYSRNYRGDFWLKRTDPDARPGENLDWDLFLGPAPKRPYDPERYFQWIRYWDYSCGIPSGLLVHRITRLVKSMGLTYPENASAHGGKFQFPESRAEIPDTFNMMIDYPGGPTVLLISSMVNDTPVAHTLRGHKATLEFTDTGFVIRPQEIYRNEVHEVVHRKTGGEDIKLHHQNWYRAIRQGEALRCDVTLGMYGIVACQMGVLSYRRRKYIAWDKTAERAVEA